MKKYIVFLIWVVGILFAFSAFAKISIRLDAPYFDNSTTTNVSNYIGKKPVMLVFFYPDCPPCEKETKEINRLYSKYKGKVFIIGISLSRDRYDIGDFIKNLHVKYPVWRIHSKSDLRNVGGILATPTIVIIDEKGRIVKRYIGKRPISILEKTLTKLLKREERCTK